MATPPSWDDVIARAMSVLFGIIAPVFALIAMGRIAVWLRFVDLPGLRGMNDFVFYVALPSLLFSSVAEAPEFHVLNIAVVYFSACLTVFGIAIAASLLVLKKSLAEAAVIGLNASYGNIVMLGVPIVAGSFGAEGLSSLLSIIALHSILMLPLATMLIEIGGSRRGGLRRVVRATGAGLARNPVIIAISLAFLWRSTGLTVPTALHGLFAMLSAAGPPLALFCLGASLPGFAGKEVLPEVAVTLALKLCVLPLLVWSLARAAGLPSVLAGVAVITAGLPTGANAFLLARRAATGMAGSASTVIMATALSLLTLSAILLRVR